MILHIVERNDKFLLFGYDIKTLKKINKSGPGNLVATIKGYQSKDKKLKPNEFVTPSTFFYGFCDNNPKELCRLISDMELSYIVIDKKATKLYRYLLSGEVFGGYQNKDFTCNIRDIKNSSFNINNVIFDTLNSYVDELLNISEKKDSKIYYIEDLNYWEPKPNKPYWLFGNTLIYLNNGKTKVYVSVSTSLEVKKEDVAVKNNNIHKVLSDTNYTISFSSDSPLIDFIVNYKDNPLGLPLLIKPNELFHKDTVRSLMGNNILTEDKYYNCDELLASNCRSLMIIFSPPGLLFKMQTEIYRTIEILMLYKDYEAIDLKPYLIDDTGKVKKSFVNTETIRVPYKNKKLIVQLGVDTLPKNNLNKIYKDFEIKLCVVNNGKTYRYFTIINDKINNKVLISYAPFNNKGIL